jgi:predicted ribosomally synthesized peptide with nif11-like leader
MHDELSRFQSALQEQSELQVGLRSVKSRQELVAFANQRGYAFTAAELDEWARRRRELREADLEGVVGGVSYEQARAAGVPMLEALYYSVFLA